jgi:hypothetical protein
MLLFRSEEHLTRWLDERHLTRGGTMTLTQQRLLADRWYGDRLSETWTKRTQEESQRVLDGVGLTDSFWNLTGE